MLRFAVFIHGGLSAIEQARLPLSVTFDDVCAHLSRHQRLFLEPDGSFVWRATAPDGQQWQVDGNLIDRGDVLSHVELRGFCPSEQFDELMRAFGWPDSALNFQLPRRGIVLTEDDFRRLASTEAGAI